MPTKPLDPESAADRAQTFLDWTKGNSRLLTVAATVVVVAAAGYWFYTRSREITAENAERALTNAKQALNAGNIPLAQNGLQQVYAKYSSTSAGVEAAMILSQMDFDSGKNQDGISLLQKVSGSGAAAQVEPTILSLEGDGYSQLGKMADAAKQYTSAANASQFQNEKAFYRAKAARAFQSAGDTTNARLLWTSLSNDPDAQTVAAEARVRLGELNARVAAK